MDGSGADFLKYSDLKKWTEQALLERIFCLSLFAEEERTSKLTTQIGLFSNKKSEEKVLFLFELHATQKACIILDITWTTLYG